MVDYKLSIQIDRPVAEVFEYLTNPKNMPQWASYIAQAWIMPEGAISVGSQMKYVARDREVTWKVTAYEKNSHITYEANYWYASNASITYECNSFEGGTELIVRDKGERNGLMRVIAPILGQLDYQIRKKQLQTIKKILEK